MELNWGKWKQNEAYLLLFVQAQQSLRHPNANRNYSSTLLLGKLDAFSKASETSLVNQSPKMRKMRAIKWMGKQGKKTNTDQFQITITLFIPLIYNMKRVFLADRYEEGRTKTLLTPVPLTPRSPTGQGAATAETPSCPEDI